MGVMVMFNFKLNQKEKKSMFILGLISFAVWFVDPYFGIGYLSIIVGTIMEFRLDGLWVLSLPFFGALLNWIFYFVYLRFLPKNQITNIGIIILIFVLLVLFGTIYSWGIYL